MLRCWGHLNHHYNKCWLLLLWFGVCFGNDFAFGILDKSVSTMIHYYPLLKRYLLAINQNVVSSLQIYKRNDSVDSTAFDSSTSEVESNCVDAIQFNDDYENGTIDLTTVTNYEMMNDKAKIRNCTTREDERSLSMASENTQLLTWAFCELQTIFRDDTKSFTHFTHYYSSGPSSFSFSTTVRSNTESIVLRGLAEWSRNADSNSSKDLNSEKIMNCTIREKDNEDTDEKHDVDYDRDNDHNDDNEQRIRFWIARQLWSFFYALELPSEFTRNQCFCHCPNLRINPIIEKPFLSHESFLELTKQQLQRHIYSILRYGL